MKKIVLLILAFSMLILSSCAICGNTTDVWEFAEPLENVVKVEIIDIDNDEKVLKELPADHEILSRFDGMPCKLQGIDPSYSVSGLGLKVYYKDGTYEVIAADSNYYFGSNNLRDYSLEYFDEEEFNDILRSYLDEESFDISEYDDIIARFPSDKILGPVDSQEDAKEQALTVWTEIYGEEVDNERPIVVLFDEESETWLVHGTLPKNTIGGVPYILIQKSDGKVLAVWHTK